MEASGLTLAKHLLFFIGDAVVEREAGLVSAAERLPRPRSVFKPAAAMSEKPTNQGDGVNCGAFAFAHAARIIEGGDAPDFQPGDGPVLHLGIVHAVAPAGENYNLRRDSMSET